MKRRMLSITLTLAMVLSLLPSVTLTASAADGVSYRDCTVSGTGTGTTVTWRDEICTDYTVVSEEQTDWGTADATTWYVVQDTIEISTRITVSGSVHLILADSGSLTASRGIHVPTSSSLTIYGQTGQSGQLIASATSGAAIGGNYSANTASGPITINGGTVNAKSSNGAGIGGGCGTNGYAAGGAGSNITINGGTVIATSNGGGAGIGGAYSSSAGGGAGSNITINGGEVTATATRGAGIGGGSASGAGRNITINGGTVNATGGSQAAGIGGGYRGSASNITINGGKVTATAGSSGAGIGSGQYGSSATNITVNGGEVDAIAQGTGAGIGSGGYGDGSSPCSNITINGGTVTATGDTSGAGIGGGNGHSVTDIYIYGGEVTATGGTYGGAGIGGGATGSGSSIYILGGTVTATGGSGNNSYGGGAGIGGGRGSSGTGINIYGGTVTATGGINGGAGIGGGGGRYATSDVGNGSSITINDGTVTATSGGYGAAGIGGGGRYNNTGGSGSNITVNGGTVIAKGGLPTGDNCGYGAGIGGGGGSSGSRIEIKDSFVHITTDPSEQTVYEWSGSGKSYSDWQAVTEVKIQPVAFTLDNITVSNPVVKGRYAEVSVGFTPQLPSALGGSGTVQEDIGNKLRSLVTWSVNGSAKTKIQNSELYVDPAESLTSLTVTVAVNDVTKTSAVGVIAPFAISTQPASTSVVYGYSTGPTLSVALNGSYTSDAVYQWYTDGAAIDSATNSSRTVETGLSVKDGGYPYYCVIKDSKGEYELTSDSATVTVEKAAPQMAAPTAKELTYTGAAQELVTEGSTDDGTLTYSLTGGNDYSSQVPTGTDAGTYTVYYKLTGDSNHNDASGQVSVTISPATPHEMKASAFILCERENVTETIELGNLILKDAGGTPTYAVTSSRYNGLTSATVNASGTLTLTANNVSKGTSDDTVTVTVSGMKNYEDATITVTVSYTDAELVGLTVKTQPRLAYKEGDKLDLGDLVIIADWSDGEKTELAYSDEGVAANPTNGITLTTAYNGRTITVSYGGMSVTTEALTVNKIIEIPEDEESMNRLVLEMGFSSSQEGLKDTKFVTPEAIVEELTNVLTQEMGTAPGDNFVTYDVVYQTSADGGNTWNDASLPSSRTITLPYPEGTDSGYTFTVVHMIVTGENAGKTEILPATNTEGGIQIEVDSLSPFAVAWKAPTSTPTPAPTGGGYVSTYTVTVSQTEHGKVTVSPTSAASGRTVTVTVTPDEGYELSKLTVTDSRGNELTLTDKGDGTYTFTMPSRAVTVTAEFAEIPPEPCDGGPDCPGYPFTDLDADAWYHEYVDYVISHGLMSGYGNGIFGPGDDLSRAMLARILYNESGGVPVNYLMTYEDVPANEWYTEAVRWATSEGVVYGYGNGKFGPSDSITREQLAVMLYRYGQSKSVNIVGAWVPQTDFTDIDEISDWAYDAMGWCTDNGIIAGKGNGILDPKGKATRAEVAAMLMRFLSRLTGG